MPSTKKPPKSARAVRPSPVSAARHKDTRANIPTEELRDFVAEEEKAPMPIYTDHHIGGTIWHMNP